MEFVENEINKPSSQEAVKKISIIEFEDALIRRKSISEGIRGHGSRPEDGRLLDKHAEKMKAFIEQEKEEFLSNYEKKKIILDTDN